MPDSVALSPFRLIPEMFQGHNKKALIAALKKFAGKDIIIADIELVIDYGSLRRTVIVTYCRESEGKMVRQFDPLKEHVKDNCREHEFPSHQFRVQARRGETYLDTEMLLNKLALLGGH